MSRRSILLLIAVMCFVISALGLGLANINFLAIGLAAFAGAFLVDSGGFRLR
jgi:hypothetical protein